MCWLSLVVRSPPARRSLSWIQSLLIELWLLVTEVSTLSLILLTIQTMVTTGILPLQGKIPMVEPGIEPGTSWLVVRSSDHQTTFVKYRRLILRIRNVLDKSFKGNQNTFYVQWFLFSKIVRFMRYCGKIWQSRTGHRLQYKTAQDGCDLHAG